MLQWWLLLIAESAMLSLRLYSLKKGLPNFLWQFFIPEEIFAISVCVVVLVKAG